MKKTALITGAYSSIEEMWNDNGIEECSIYLITGKEKYIEGVRFINDKK